MEEYIKAFNEQVSELQLVFYNTSNWLLVLLHVIPDHEIQCFIFILVPSFN